MSAVCPCGSTNLMRVLLCDDCNAITLDENSADRVIEKEGLPGSLLPCPFCGHNRHHIYGQGTDPENYSVVCDGCAAEGPWEKTRWGAAKAWNMRFTHAAQQQNAVDRAMPDESRAAAETPGN